MTLSPRTQLTAQSLLLLLLASFLPTAHAAEAPADHDRRLASNSKMTVTLGDFRADLLRLPPELRGQVLVSQRRVAAVIFNVLKAKTFAAEARKLGLDKDPLNARAIALNADRVLTAMYIDHIKAQAEREFEAKIEGHTRHANDLYRSQPDRYTTPEEIHAAHILLGTTRDKAQARALAEKLRAEILAGADFAKLAREHSDDPGSKDKGGDLGFFEAKTMVQSFGDAALTLTAANPISPIVESRFGLHLIKFIDRKSPRRKTFDEVKKEILAEQRQKFVNDAIAESQKAFNEDPSIEVDDQAFEALHLKLTPEMLRAAGAVTPNQ